MKRPRKKYAFNLFDVFILLFAAALCAFAVLYFSPPAKQGAPASITLTLSGVKEELGALLAQGDTVYNGDGTQTLGTIRSLSIETGVLSVTDPQSGKASKVPYPDNTLVDITLLLFAEGAVPDEDGCTIGTVSLAPNETATLRTASFSGTAICQNIIFGGAA